MPQVFGQSSALLLQTVKTKDTKATDIVVNQLADRFIVRTAAQWI